MRLVAAARGDCIAPANDRLIACVEHMAVAWQAGIERPLDLSTSRPSTAAAPLGRITNQSILPLCLAFSFPSLLRVFELMYKVACEYLLGFPTLSKASAETLFSATER